MAHDWLPYAQVVAWLARDDLGGPGGGEPDPRLDAAREAAADYIEGARPDVDYAAADGVPAAVLMAGYIATRRLFDRATGDGFPEFGPAVALLQVDPDVSALLGLGQHARPRVG